MSNEIAVETPTINLFEKIAASLRAINDDGSFRDDVTFQDVNFTLNPIIGNLIPHETDPNTVWVIPKSAGVTEIKATYIAIVNK